MYKNVLKSNEKEMKHNIALFVWIQLNFIFIPDQMVFLNLFKQTLH